MPNKELHTAISNPRFYRYFNACGKNKRKALKLYRSNIIVSQKIVRRIMNEEQLIVKAARKRKYRKIRKGSEE